MKRTAVIQNKISSSLMLCIRYVDKSGSQNVQRQTVKLCYIAGGVHFTDKFFLENAAGSSMSMQIRGSHW